MGSEPSDLILVWMGDPCGRAESFQRGFADACRRLSLFDRDLTDIGAPDAISNDNVLCDCLETALGDQDLLICDRPDRATAEKRSAPVGALIPLLHLLSRRFEIPLALFELAAIALLNLLCDHFA